MGSGLARCQIPVVPANRPVEEKREAIDRAQRRFFQLGMNIIQPTMMFIAQCTQPRMEPLEWLAMRRSNQQIIRQAQQSIN